MSVTGSICRNCVNTGLDMFNKACPCGIAPGSVGLVPINIETSSSAVKLKIKKIADNAIIPKYAKAGDAGLDLTATSKSWDEEHEVVVFGTGLAIEIPPGHVGLIFPRSSNYKVGLSLANCVGVIDSGYRGEIKFMFRPTGRPRKNYQVGDRIGQLIVIPYPQVEIEEVAELSDSERGDGGFGSSGK